MTVEVHQSTIPALQDVFYSRSGTLILALLSGNRKLSVLDIAEKTGFKPETIRNRLNDLKSKGIVQEQKCGNIFFFSLRHLNGVRKHIRAFVQKWEVHSKRAEAIEHVRQLKKDIDRISQFSDPDGLGTKKGNMLRDLLEQTDEWLVDDLLDELGVEYDKLLKTISVQLKFNILDNEKFNVYGIVSFADTSIARYYRNPSAIRKEMEGKR